MYTSEPVNGPADFSTLGPGQIADHQNVLIEWTVPTPANPSSAPGNPRVLLRIDWPQFNHDGGALNFGPDGFLYIACGDGGGADDENAGHGLIGNGQDPTSALGKILRIDPAGNNATNGQYGIPAENPFTGRSGYVQEIYAYGFRNPFRFSFDSTTGKLYAGDVGQNKIEEVDIVARGGNYGWSIKEGTFCFDRNGTGPGQVTDASSCGPLGLVEPIAEYDHDEGIAIVGGFVHRGARVRELRGRYIFGDYARAFGANNGRLFFLNTTLLEWLLELSWSYEHHESAAKASAAPPGAADAAAGASGISGPVAGAFHPRAQRGDPTPVCQWVAQ